MFICSWFCGCCIYKNGNGGTDGGGVLLSGGVMVTTVFIFGYEKSDSSEPLFVLSMFSDCTRWIIYSESLCIQVQILDEIKSLCYNKLN